MQESVCAGTLWREEVKPAASVEHFVTLHTSRWTFVSSIWIYPNGLPGLGVVKPCSLPPSGHGSRYTCCLSTCLLPHTVAQCIDLQSYL